MIVHYWPDSDKYGVYVTPLGALEYSFLFLNAPLQERIAVITCKTRMCKWNVVFIMSSGSYLIGIYDLKKNPSLNHDCWMILNVL